MSSGDREKRFTRIVDEHADALNRYLRRRYVSADATDVEDLLADVLAIAWRRLDEIPEEATAAWLFGVARHRLSNARTRRSRRDRIMAPVRPRLTTVAAEDEAIADLSLREALQRLPDKEREALTLTAWEGLTPTELAVALGVSVNAAAIRLSKAKAHLLGFLEENGEESSLTAATRSRS
jgi:RNA polymerase sigma-70 factor (ECF subfamily)